MSVSFSNEAGALVKVWLASTLVGNSTGCVGLRPSRVRVCALVVGRNPVWNQSYLLAARCCVYLLQQKVASVVGAVALPEREHQAEVVYVAGHACLPSHAASCAHPPATLHTLPSGRCSCPRRSLRTHLGDTDSPPGNTSTAAHAVDDASVQISMVGGGFLRRIPLVVLDESCPRHCLRLPLTEVLRPLESHRALFE